MSPSSMLAVAALAGSCACHAADATPSPVNAYYYFLHWTSVGDAQQAAAQFAADAVVTVGPHCSAQSPCAGRDEIRTRYVLPLMAARHLLPMKGARFDGSVLRAGGCVFAFDGGHIASVRHEGADRGVEG
jgi:hypothetical protein